MADGVSQAVGTAVRVAGQTKDSITLFRDSIRQAPLMMGFLLMGLGYIVGTITTVRPRQISGR
jgi:vacuolar-type H+-ATPase subunit I/STV1